MYYMNGVGTVYAACQHWNVNRDIILATCVTAFSIPLILLFIQLFLEKTSEIDIVRYGQHRPAIFLRNDILKDPPGRANILPTNL